MEDNKRLSGMDAQAAPTPGPTLYIINLCASLAPVPTTGNTLPGLENYRLYQLARVEDGRTRHRLRLGFFTSESHANSVLAVVRQKYPTAFVASLGVEDRRFTRGHLPAAAAHAPLANASSTAKTNTAPTSARNGTQATAAEHGAQLAAATSRNGARTPPSTPSDASSTRDGSNGTAGSTAITARNGAANGVRPRAATVHNGTQASAHSEPEQPPPSRQATAGKTQPPRQSGPADVIEVTWEPDDAARAEASSARLKALTEDECLDEFTWEGPALTAADTAQARATSTKAPVTAAPAIPVLTLTETASMPMPTLTPGDAPPFKARGAMPTPALQSPAPRSPTHGVAAGTSRGHTPPPPNARTAPGTGVGQAKPPLQRRPPAGATQLPQQDEFSAPTLEPSLAGPAGLDSTQTLRALTHAELSADTPEKWFAIQLVASEQPANLDTMPHLDIFEAYRLYSVALAAEGRITHSLRLGFFKEDVSAEAVCGYLRTFFPAPTVLRVSLAEQLRFKDAPQPRRLNADDARSNVIELNDARAGRNTAPLTLIEPAAPAPTQPAAAMAAAVTRVPPTLKAAASGVPQPTPGTRTAPPAIKRPQATRTKPSSKYRTKKTLTDALMDEARDLQLGESGSRKAPQNNSLLSRLVGKLTK